MEKNKTSLNLQKINDFEIKPIPGLESKSNANSHDLWEEEYPIIFLLAKKKTGKSTCIYNILNKIVDNNTIVIIFCGQIYKDKSYEEIVKSLKNKKAKYILENSFTDKDGNDQLENLINNLKNERKSVWASLDPFYDGNDSVENDSELDQIPNHKLIIIIDDMSTKLRSPVIEKLTKESRHMRITLIIASQALTDLTPNSINQLSYVCAFSQIPDENRSTSKLYKLYDILGLTISWEPFRDLYRDATRPDKANTKSRNFLFIDVDNNKFRKNFNHSYIL